MDREIKFRGKRLDNGEWVYGYYVVELDGRHCIMTDVGDQWDGIKCLTEIEVVPETVGQFTGLLDKNGRELYGRQKVQAFNQGWRREFTIEWINERARFMVWEGSQPNISFDLTADNIIDYQVEVLFKEATP